MDSSGFRARLTDLIGQARGRALKSGRNVLVSFSERVPIRNPLASLEHCYRATSSDMQLADHVAAGMAYWARPSQGFAIAAFGAAAVLSPTGPDRFALVDDEWKFLISNSLTESDSGAFPGVGPILMGGFSFDPDSPQTERWSGFPSAHMIVPQIHLTRAEDDTWLTLSATVDESDRAALAVDNLVNLRSAMLDEPHEAIANDGTLIETSDDRPESEWRDVVSHAIDEIRSSELRKVVLARSIHGITSEPVNSFAVIRQLSRIHRDALIFGYWRNDKVFVGASPERLVQLEGRTVSASSLAGTVGRGLTPAEDHALALELTSSTKDLAEHALVRDMLHDILSDVAENVSSPEVPEILTLSNVHHLHTEVRGELCDDYSLLDVVSRLHPTPAVGGTPREEALAFISKHEELDRGWYAAPVGWLDQNSGEFAVALRSGIISGDEFALYAGCGIVSDSDPEEELEESILKLEPMRAAIASSFDASENDIMMAARDTE